MESSRQRLEPAAASKSAAPFKSPSTPAPKTMSAPPTTSAPPKKKKTKIITPQMLQRRSLHVKNLPLVLKSAEQAGDVSVELSQVTEVVCNKRRGRSVRGVSSRGGGDCVPVSEEENEENIPLGNVNVRSKGSRAGDHGGRQRSFKSAQETNGVVTVERKANKAQSKVSKQLKLAKSEKLQAGVTNDMASRDDSSNGREIVSNEKQNRVVDCQEGNKVRLAETAVEDIVIGEQSKTDEETLDDNLEPNGEVDTDRDHVSQVENVSVVTETIMKEDQKSVVSVPTNKQSNLIADEEDQKHETKAAHISASQAQTESVSLNEEKMNSPSLLQASQSREQCTEQRSIASGTSHGGGTTDASIKTETGEMPSHEKKNNSSVAPISTSLVPNEQTNVGITNNTSTVSNHPTLSTLQTTRNTAATTMQQQQPPTQAINTPKPMNKKKKKKQMTIPSFLGQHFKTIDEEVQDNGIDKYERDDAQVLIHTHHQQHQQQQIPMPTLNNTEIISVQSSITTDDFSPNLLKRTSSLIRNPLLRRKKKVEQEVLASVKNGKLAARVDNCRVEEFDDVNKVQEKQLERYGGEVVEKSRVQLSGNEEHDVNVDGKRAFVRKRSGVQLAREEHDQVNCVVDSEDNVHQPLCIKEQLTSFDDIYNDDYVMAEKEALVMTDKEDSNLETNDVTKHPHLPQVDNTIKMEMKSHSFRLKAVSGSLPPPIVEQMMGIGRGVDLDPILHARSRSGRGIDRVRSVDTGTQTDDDQPQLERDAHQANHVSTYPLNRNPSTNSLLSDDIGLNLNTNIPSPSTPRGTIGDIFESIGLFSARLCVTTGTAIASCSRACNDVPMDVARSNSFAESHHGMHSIFRSPSPNKSSNALFAMDNMPQEELITRQLSTRSDMASSVDGMFRRTMSGQMSRLPRNIAAKPNKAVRDVAKEEAERKNGNKEKACGNKKQAFGGLKKGIRSLAKKRVTVMYQV